MPVLETSDGPFVAHGIMTRRQFSKRMREIVNTEGTETAHVYADELMCELLHSLGYGAGVQVFRAMNKWYA